MVKAVAFFKRRSGMAVDEFQGYWLARHPDVVTKLAGVRRYVQSHTRAAAYRTAEPIYDGIAELWFDDTDALRAATTTPEWARAKAEYPSFLAPGPVTFIRHDRARDRRLR